MGSDQVAVMAAATIVVGGNEVVVEGLRSLLQSNGDLAVVGVPCSGDVGLRIMREDQPDVLVVDLQEPDEDKQERPAASAGRLGVAAGRDAPPEQLEPEVGLLVGTLSPRERTVLELVTAGYSNQRIAEARRLSMHTVRTHVQSILVKLGVHSRLEAAVFALRHQLVPAGAPGATPPW